MTSDKIRLITVDDSLVYRSLIRQALKENPDIELIAEAISGEHALPRIKKYKPDVVLLDVNMPGMNGIEVLKLIREADPSVKVIMFSVATSEGAKTTIEALHHGAVDFITKPDNLRREELSDYVRDKIIKKIGGIKTNRSIIASRSSEILKDISAKKIPRSYYEFCVIGISTGGPAALEKLLPALPASLKGAVLIVQHMPANFTKELAISLDARCPLKVTEAQNGDVVQRGHVYIAPGGQHMTVLGDPRTMEISLNSLPPEESCRPSANRSMAEAAGSLTLGVIMTGMGRDGFEGMKILHGKGAYLLAQDKTSFLIYGMPSHPVEAGLIDESHNIDGLANRISELLGAV